MRIHFIVSALLLLVLVVLMIQSDRQLSGGNNGSGIPAVLTYDYVMNGLDFMQYDAEGKPSYRLIADSITHYVSPEYDAIAVPRFEIFQESSPSWTISALEGRSQKEAGSDLRRVDLQDSVVIHGVDSRDREMKIYTDSLSVYPDSRKASTSDEVRIEGEDSQVTGTGMFVDLETSRITVLANVRGNYGKQRN